MSIALFFLFLLLSVGIPLSTKAQTIPNLPPAEAQKPKLPPVQEFLPEEFLTPQPENFPVIPETIAVEEFNFLGNTAFSQEELRALIKDLTGDSVTFAQLLEARSRITQHYINQGYITSGAYLPPHQVIEDGIVTIQIIEGNLITININGLQRLTSNYIRSRIFTNLDSPLNVNNLVEILEQLRRNPLIENLSAELAATSQPGESLLNLDITNADPITLQATISNHNAPTIGTWEQEIQIGHNNFFGWGDRALLSYTNTEGGDRWQLDYTLPLNPQDGTLSLSYQNFNANIIEEPFNQVDLETASEKYKITLRQPIINRLTEELALGVILFHQTSQTRLLGVPFPLTLGAEEDGETKISAVRLFQEWTKQSPQDIIFLRNQLSFGVSWLDTTENNTAPDSNFLSWQLDGQWLHSFGSNHSLRSRIQAQISDRALLSSEKLSIGGVNNIRGYRRDLYVVDRGILASVEYRFPLVRINPQQNVIQSLSFFDMAWVGNTGNFPDPDPNYLASVGIGLRWELTDNLTTQVSWALPLVELTDRAEERFLFSISLD